MDAHASTAPRKPFLAWRRNRLLGTAFPHSRARRCLQTLACGVLLLSLFGCMGQPDTALRIGTNVWIGSEPLYLARDLGRLDSDSVQLVEYPSASEVLRAFRNEAIDGMVISV